LIVYDDYEVKRVEVARTRGIEQVEKMAAQLKIGSIPANLMGIKSPMPVGIKIKEESRKFIKKILQR